MAEFVNVHVGSQLQVATAQAGNEGSPILAERDPLCMGIGPTAIPGTIFASGSEVNLALDVSHKLATENTYSKVISVPCQEIFFKQSKDYKNNILNETNYKISIEAGRSDTWSKFVGEKGLSFGVEDFGKSAPYKEIFKDFKLTANEISNKTKDIIYKNKIL